MAMGGREIAYALTAVIGLIAADAEGGDPVARPIPPSPGAVGHVAMPHPNACACACEEKGFCEGLWEKMRPGHRDRYLARQHMRHLNHPECPPWCMENFGYYQTCWRRFPEHTLGCRYCEAPVSLPLPAAPVSAPPLPTQSAPPAPPSPPPAEPGPVPPTENAIPYNPSPEEADLEEPFTRINGRWNDPAWQAGLRSQ